VAMVILYVENMKKKLLEYLSREGFMRST